MATKKKRSKSSKAPAKKKAGKKTAGKKQVKQAKAAANKKLAAKKSAQKKAATKKSAVRARTTPKTKSASKKTAGARPKRAGQPSLGRSQSVNLESYSAEEVRAMSAGQAGSLQGLSHTAGADSESVDELIEEGNAFEAGIVAGVETADEADGKEVRTREVPEDDVPGEYLDQD